MTIKEYIIKRCKEEGVSEDCCTSCIEDKLIGYYDIEGCCCRHFKYYEEALQLGLKYIWEK